MKDTVIGNLKSRTNWLALVTAVTGYLQMPDTQRILAKILAPVMDAEGVEFALASLTMACGLAAIYVRNITTEPVAAKAAK